jgi:Holliday junction DNA helicase RuvB
VVEPFLLQQGLIGRTPRGRVLSAEGYRYLGLRAPANAATSLFDE